MPQSIPTADGVISLCEEHLARTLAASASMQTLLGSTGEAAARDRMYLHRLPPPASGSEYTLEENDSYRPFLILFTAPTAGFRLARRATGTYIESGRLGVALEIPLDEADRADCSAAMRRATNLMGLAVDEMAALAYEANYLAIDSIEVNGPYVPTEEEATELGWCLRFELMFSHGEGL